MSSFHSWDLPPTPISFKFRFSSESLEIPQPSSKLQLANPTDNLLPQSKTVTFRDKIISKCPSLNKNQFPKPAVREQNTLISKKFSQGGGGAQDLLYSGQHLQVQFSIQKPKFQRLLSLKKSEIILEQGLGANFCSNPCLKFPKLKTKQLIPIQRKKPKQSNLLNLNKQNGVLETMKHTKFSQFIKDLHGLQREFSQLLQSQKKPSEPMKLSAINLTNLLKQNLSERFQ